MEFITNLDQSISAWNQATQLPGWLDQGIRTATFFGSSSIVAVLISIVGLYLQRSKGWKVALVFVLGTSGACLTCESVKFLVKRPRPEISQMRTPIDKIPTSPSFPSGHSFSAAAIYPAIAFIIALPLKNLPLKILITALGFVLASLVGFSRIYLGVHFLSDVLVGLTGGFTFAIVIAFLVKMPFILGQTSTPEHRNRI